MKLECWQSYVLVNRKHILLVLEGVRSDGNVEVLRSRCTERILESRGLHCFNSSGDNGFMLCSSLKGNFFVQRLRGMKAMLETRGQQRDPPSRGQ
jgi:hypothetical protein